MIFMTICLSSTKIGRCFSLTKSFYSNVNTIVWSLKSQINAIPSVFQPVVRIYDIPDNTFESDEDDDSDESDDDESDDDDDEDGKTYFH